MHKYRLVAKKGEGTFSEVLKAQSIKNGKYVAIKCMKNHFDSLDQVNNLREIQALRRLSPHPNIIKLLEVLYDQPTGRLALVFELMDMNIYELIRGRRHYVAEDRVKNYMYQLMKSMDHMHRNGIFHRDIKPENILIMDDCLKLADFGSCRGIYSKQPYTEYISTRWYRAPECLLTDGYYNYKMDMWGVGCVFFEIVSLFPLFPGTNELDQIQKIHNILGTPPADLLGKMKKRSAHMDFNFPPKEGTGIPRLIPHVSPECSDLIVRLLAYNPDDRLSARQALRHAYFRDLREAEKKQKALMSPEAPVHSVAHSELPRESSPAGSDDMSQPEIQLAPMMAANSAAPAAAAAAGAAAAAAAPLAPPAVHKESSDPGLTALPSINAPKYPSGSLLQPTPMVPDDPPEGGFGQESGSGGGAHLGTVGPSSLNSHNHHLPGLHMQGGGNGGEATSGDEGGGLPMIGGSLKANQGGRSKGAAAPNHAGYEAAANFKNRAGRGAGGTTKFVAAQKQVGSTLASLGSGTMPKPVPVVAGGGTQSTLTQDPPAPPASYKFKGTAVKSQGKYVSPYSLRTLSISKD